jgi:hypothetical protein
MWQAKIESLFKDKDLADENYKLNSKQLNGLNENKKLGLTEYNNSNSFLANQNKAIAQAQIRVDSTKNDLIKARNRLNDAQDELKQCELEFRNAQTKKDTALN